MTHKEVKSDLQKIHDVLHEHGVKSSSNGQIARDLLDIFRPTRKENIDKLKVLMLKRAAQHVIDTKKPVFKKSELNLIDFGQSAYGRFGALRFHGLIAKMKDDDGKVIKGDWIITRLGWAFLRNDPQHGRIAKYVYMQDNHIRDDLERGPLVGIIDVFKGSDYLQTNFEYVDVHGNFVGVRPSYPQNKTSEQASLL